MLSMEWNDDEYREVIREEALEEGKAEGLSQGLAQGISQEKIATARRMKEEGEPVEKIANYTGLPMDEISAL